MTLNFSIAEFVLLLCGFDGTEACINCGFEVVSLEDGALRVPHEVQVFVVKEPKKMAFLGFVVAQDSALVQVPLFDNFRVHVASRCDTAGSVNGENVNDMPKIQSMDQLHVHVRVARMPRDWEVPQDAVDAFHLLPLISWHRASRILPMVSDCVSAHM